MERETQNSLLMPLDECNSSAESSGEDEDDSSAVQVTNCPNLMEHIPY